MTKATATQELIYKQMGLVMTDLGLVGMNHRNKDQGYDFRSFEDVQNAANPAFTKHGVTVYPVTLECAMDTYQTKSGTAMQRALLKVEFHFAAGDGSEIVASVYGSAADSGDKAVGKAHTAAAKTAYTQTLCIRTENWSEDSDASTPEPQAAPASQPQSAPAQRQEQPKARVDDQGHELLSDDDLATIKLSAAGRCEELKLDPVKHSRLCLIDVAADGDKTIDEFATFQKADLKALLEEVSKWSPRDDAPGFVNDSEPQAAA